MSRGTRRIIPARAGFTPVALSVIKRWKDHPRSRGVYYSRVSTGRSRSGSSPLARGLRGDGERRLRGLRIIPARAGFTLKGARSALTFRDHPRSRGVYSRSLVWAWLTVGSSPLARGLRVVRLWVACGPGIIPARAGFTPRPVACTTWLGDHPRSRGVYAQRADSLAMPCGSSPLARGLPRPPKDIGDFGRIIPARAGFTTSISCTGSARSDHPRSRGVYNDYGIISAPDTGSSPLARGLLSRHPQRLRHYRDHPRSRGVYVDWLSADGAWAGIIPARAGFTWIVRRRPIRPPDHPRSRGVYSAHCVDVLRADGSSPLARGLHGAVVAAALDAGIIPARAGFTYGGSAVPGDDADHPRSRGVYTASSGTAPATWGSSPLARGLPDGPRRLPFPGGIIPARAGFTRNGAASSIVLLGSSPLARGLQAYRDTPEQRRRIIPARAGFTHHRPSPGPRWADHPRSRGVYPGFFTWAVTVPGSSPLARGLHGCRGPSDRRGRIIPARAGFTCSPRSCCAQGRDHPRSRGVYVSRTSTRSDKCGSSPLARGLRRRRFHRGSSRRIIPARAGFTAQQANGASASADHPRSRGVYVYPSRYVNGTVGSSPLARGLPRRAGLRRRGPRIIPARAGFTRRS